LIFSTHNKNRLISLHWGICAVEALLSILYIMLLPSDSKNVFLFNFSLVRLLSVACILIIAILCSYLAIITLKGQELKRFGASFGRLEVAEGWFFFFSVFGLLISLFFLGLTPPFLRGARIERLTPIFVLGGLYCLQIGVVFVIFKKTNIRQTATKILKFILWVKNDVKVGLGLLLLSLVIGLFTLFYTYYNPGDEGDTYTVGWIMSTGKILYRDVFSHHFPFSYTWVSIISTLFGPSIISYRISLLLLRVVLFFAAMRISKSSFVIGLTSLAWSLIGPMYLGNMLVYYSFDGILITSSAFVVLAILNKEVPYSLGRATFASLLIGFAILNDPIMVFPGIIILFSLALSGYRKGQKVKQKIFFTTFPFLGAGLVLILYGGYLAVTSSLDDFIQNGILFNLQVYSRYTGPIFSFPRLLEGITKGLNLFDPSIWKYLGPYYQWDDFRYLENWAFSAPLFRLSIIVASLIMIFKKNFFGGVFTYLLGSMLFFRGFSFFHGSPFILFSLVAASFILINSCLAVLSLLAKDQPIPLFRQLVRWSIWVIPIAISVVFLWLNLRMGEYWINHRTDLSYEKQFGHSIETGENYRHITCGNEDASLLVYPLETTINFFSKIPPTSRYLFMTPWVANVGQQEVISDLSGKAAVVYIAKDTDIWGYQVNDYLRSLIAYLDKEYIEVEANIYISPKIKQYCDSMQ